jgi:hypothetical protein
MFGKNGCFYAKRRRCPSVDDWSYMEYTFNSAAYKQNSQQITECTLEQDANEDRPLLTPATVLTPHLSAGSRT